MKKSTRIVRGISRLSFLTALLFIATTTRAQLLTQEFNFSGNLTSNGWVSHSGAGTNPIATTTGLFYTGHSGSGVGNAALVGSSGEDDNTTFASQSGNGTVVYASFLCNVTDASSAKTGDYFFHLGSPGGATWTTYTARVFTRIVSGSINFGLSNTSTATYGTTTFSKNTTYLIILKYTINTGGADPVSMWVLPSGMPSTEAAAGAPEVTNTTTAGGNDVVSAIGLRQGSATTAPQTVVDAIRIGSTWASVVPSSGSAPSVQASAITLSATTNSVSASWTAGNGDGRVVKINTTNTFTDPTGGASYTGNATYSGTGEQVVSAGTALSATVSNLTAGQTYWFRAYEYANAGLLYNTTTTTGNPASITINYPTPTLTLLTPSSATAGGSSFTLTVSGTDFYPASVINWGGTPKVTTYVNSTTLTAAISSADIASAGTVNVTVTNPAPGGGASSAEVFTINANTAPIITVSASLSNFVAVAGTPSSSQSYTVAGANLTDDITITPPTGFEIRTGANPFSASPIVLTQSGGVVSTTTIDVRMNVATSGTVTGSISHTSSGAPTQTLALTGFALASEPTTPSTISFGTIDATTLVVNTSGGSGASRIIVARQGSAVSYLPTDGAAASGVNANFSLATDQGSGNKIVYDGTGTSVTVTNLSPSTNYQFAVFEYNGTSVTANYQTSGAGTGSATTIAAEPTTNATVTLARIKSDTAYTALSGGNGTARLIVLSTSPVSFVPADGSTYIGASSNPATATDLGGGNYLVYNGAPAATFNMNGLVAGTTYYLRAYEFNGTGALTNYRTSAFGSLTFTMPSNIPYAAAGSTYTQDFNGLPSAATTGMTGFGLGPYYLSTPNVNATNMTGWQHTLVGGSSADLVFAVDNGSSSSGGVKSYGATASTNRSLGSLATGTSVPAFGAVFINNTSQPLTTLNISYTGQQWRNGGVSGTTPPAPNVLTFSYSLNGTSITTGTFTAVPALNFFPPNSGGTAAALDGTLPANQVAVSGTVALGTNWLPGQALVIRWTDNNDAGNDEGMAIDNFSFSALGPQAPTAQDSMIVFTNVVTTSMDVNWQNGNGASRIVVINTTNSFTNPVDGTTYTPNTVYSGSGEQVLYNGSGSAVHVDGLTAGSTYYFRVFGYNGSGIATVYNTATALDNPSTQTTVAPSAATNLKITAVNGGTYPVSGTPFSIVVQSQDASGNPQSVNQNTTVSLSLLAGFGTLSGNLSGVISAGSSSVTISGVLYSPGDFMVNVRAATTAGQSLVSDSTFFDVYGVANQLTFMSTPSAGIVNTPVSQIEVDAYRADYTLDVYYTGAVTLSVVSGPGTISGTTTVNCIGGIALFNGITFSLPGTYTLEATATGLLSATSTTIIITANPTMTEVVVPKFLAGKTAASAHNARVPFAVCLQFENLVPGYPYDLKAGVGTDTTPSTSYGSGNIWTGAVWAAGTISNAFTADVNGSSGPVWVYIQPTANSTNNRFAAGQAHNLRIGIVPSGGLIPTTPNFVGSKTITGLDVGATATSAATTDDGAFVKGSSSSCIGSKYILLFNNTTGTGDPLAVYQARTMVAPNTTSQTELPAAVNDVFLQTSTNPIGDYGAAIPIGANNPSGVQRIEVRNADNTLFNVVTDADGNWGTGANTSTLVRRDVATITSAMANLNTVTVSATSTGETCTGALDGTATAQATTSAVPVGIVWNTTPIQTGQTATGLSAGVYSVIVTDNNGCTETATTTVSAPPGATITAGGSTTFCNGGSVTLTAGTASAYLWSNGETTQSITVNAAGTYTVTATIGTCVATSIPTTVTVNNYQFTGTVFSESMGTPTGTTAVNSYTGWQNSTPISFNAGTTGTDVRITTVSSGYSGASGSGNVFFGTSGGNLKTLTISGINTTGYSTLTLSFGLLRTDLNNAMTVEVSTDGTTFTPLTISQPAIANAYSLISVSSGIPATSNLRIRFSKNSTTSFRLDDVKISGTASAPAVTASGPTSVCGAGSVVLSANVPSGIVWSFNGSTTRNVTVNAAGSYTFTATGTNGCTATAVPVVFTINPEPTASINSGTIACNGGSTTIAVTAAGGTAPYTNTGNFTVGAGTYSYVVTDVNGCDDTVSVSLTQPAAISGSGSASACDSYTWSANGSTYTTSGTYTAVVPAANGCDSTATLNLTITPSTQNTQTAASCGSYVWSYNGQTYTQTGTYNVVTGCHTETLVLTVTPVVNTVTTDTACTSYTWSVNNQTYTQSGTYVNVNGCNSDTLNLTIQTCSSGVTLNLTAFLEGYYAGTSTMVPVLTNQGIANVIGDEVDTILVELRDVIDPSIVVEAVQMILKTDGSATGVLSTASVGNSYWISIRHRMSVNTWSQSPVLLNATTNYDFSSSDAQAYGNNLREVETGVWAIFSGDMNQDEFVDSFDFSIFQEASNNFLTGYEISDLNGDGFVDSFDFGYYQFNSNNFIIAAHP